MISDVSFKENNIGKNLFDKLDRLRAELISKSLLDKCTPLDKKKIFIMINELKYDANRVKNTRFAR